MLGVCIGAMMFISLLSLVCGFALSIKKDDE